MLAMKWTKWKSHIASENVKTAHTWEKLNTFFSKPSNSNPRCLPKRNKTHLLKDLNFNVCSSFIHNGPILKTIQMSVNRWLNKQMTEIPQCNFKKWATKKKSPNNSRKGISNLPWAQQNFEWWWIYPALCFVDGHMDKQIAKLI